MTQAKALDQPGLNRKMHHLVHDGVNAATAFERALVRREEYDGRGVGIERSTRAIECHPNLVAFEFVEPHVVFCDPFKNAMN